MSYQRLGWLFLGQIFHLLWLWDFVYSGSSDGPDDLCGFGAAANRTAGIGLNESTKLQFAKETEVRKKVAADDRLLDEGHHKVP